MHRIIKYIIGMVWLATCNTAVSAQQKNSDDLGALREFAKLGELYKHPPVRLSIHLQNTASPVTTARDTLQADMDLYYGGQVFYMQSEGLEEIVNDSLLVTVNSQTKQILLFANNQQVKKNIEKTVSMFLPDSSVEKLSQRFSSSITDAGENKKKIELTSREIVYGTSIPKETATVIYRASSYEPVECSQTKVRLVPVDSVVYQELKKDPAYTGKLVSSPSAKGNLFFIVKELTTRCLFGKIEYEVKEPPVAEHDRIVKTDEGGYKPAKGFEDYTLTKQF